jgi:hemolysin activation/secretion protein
MTRPSERFFTPCLLALLITSASPGAWSQAVVAAAPKVQVTGFSVTGNTLLPAALIDATLARYTGERSLDELKQAALSVQGLYRDAGWGAVVAFLPEQTSAGGQVRITVIEGRLATVGVAGNKQFTEANIRASLPALVVGQTPRVREIDAQIQLANENPGKQIEVLLQPGGGAGQVEARITVTEEPITRWTASLDNTGNAQTGRARASLGYQHAALWSLDHVLSLQAQVAPEKLDAVTVLSANYRLPFYAQGAALDVYAAYSDVDGGTTGTPAGPLQFAGKGRIAGMRLTKYLPRLGEVDQRVVLGLDHRDYINNCAIIGLPAGACGNAGESVSVQPISLEYVVQRGGSSPMGASIGLQHNLQLGGSHAGDANFEAVRPGSKPRYTLLRFSLFAAPALAEDWRVQARVVGQASAHALVSGEQFGIGGASSVRGYEERELTGDSGFSATLEVTSPNLMPWLRPGAADSGSSLNLVSFLDAGWVSNRLQTPCRLNQTECSLGGVGLGLRYASGPLQLRLDLAHATEAAARTGRHDTRAHVSVSYSF